MAGRVGRQFLRRAHAHHGAAARAALGAHVDEPVGGFDHVEVVFDDDDGVARVAQLHANNANQAIDRIIHFFEADRHSQLFMDLSLNLKAMVAQQLIPTPDGNSRRAAIEILINSPLISDLIRKGEIHEIKDLMKRSRELGMQTFDQALFDLYKAKQITYKDALKHADSPNDLRLQIKLSEEGGDRLLHASANITFDGQA